MRMTVTAMKMKAMVMRMTMIKDSAVTIEHLREK